MNTPHTANTSKVRWEESKHIFREVGEGGGRRLKTKVDKEKLTKEGGLAAKNVDHDFLLISYIDGVCIPFFHQQK